MKNTVFWTLLGLNAVLLFIYAGQFNHVERAEAQFRRPADYLLIPGGISTGSTSLVYIIDATNGKLGAMAYDDSSHSLQTMPSLDLNRIYAIAQEQQH